SLPNVDGAVLALKQLVGDKADVVAQKDAALTAVANSMNLVRGTTSTGLWISLAVGGVVVFFTMMLIIRERQREIGILKAIGSGNGDLLAGFAWEALTISVLGAIAGVALFITGGQYLAQNVIMKSITSSATALPSVLPGAVEGMRQGVQGALRNLSSGHFISQLGTITVSLSLALVGKAIAAAIGLGLLGGLIPAIFALRLKPAEVLRND
ncbi:MAG: FtsX-like permease family protein, partial [bacterium]|nr:FtsX-like permease family protein [bacterium]